ncbi:hypothetical protein RugamoR64_33610 [Duganella rhizosphaerae]
MVTSKSKAKPAHGSVPKAKPGGVNSSASTTVANPYAISDKAAALAVRRAGIVTVGGKLSRVYK